MNKINDGGPAYPGSHFHTGENWIDGGMSLRDRMAIAAMQAIATTEFGSREYTFDERAKWAYRQADAMLRAREASDISPASGDWIEWHGGPCPTRPDALIEYFIRFSSSAGSSLTARASELEWDHAAKGSDIVRYRVMKP